MSEPGERFVCRNCGRERPASELERDGWCSACRRVVVRRATLAARVVGALAALLAGAGILRLSPSPRFMVIWVAVVALAYFVVFKVVQRVAFEFIRGRGVPPPRE